MNPIKLLNVAIFALSLLVTSNLHAQELSINSFILVDTDNDNEIQVISDGDVIDIATLPTTNISIVVNTIPETVGSVYFTYDNLAKLENHAPYAIKGDSPRGNYKAWNYDLRTYELTATPYSKRRKKGLVGESKTVSFTLTNSIKVSEFILVDADSNTELQVINDNDVIDIATLPTANISIIAKTIPETVGSVLFEYNNRKKLENYIPYAIKGDSSRSDYRKWNYELRSYELTATPYSNRRKKGFIGTSKKVNFTLVNNLVVTELVLVDADNDVELQIINNGDIININDLPTENLSVIAKTNTPNTGSVQFSYDGTTKTENYTPFAIKGDNHLGDYTPWNYELRTYELTATPYTRRRLKGELGTAKTVTFTFVEEEEEPIDPDPLDPPAADKLYISGDQSSPLLNLIELENGNNASFYASRNGAIVVFKYDGTQVIIELDAEGEITKIYDSLGTTEIAINCNAVSCSVTAEDENEQLIFNIPVNNAGNDLSEISAIPSSITDNSVFVNVQKCGTTFYGANTVASLCPSSENKQFCTASLGEPVDAGRYEVNLPLLTEAAEVLSVDDVTFHSNTVGAFCEQTDERILANDTICSTLAESSATLGAFCSGAIDSVTESCDKSVTETPNDSSAEEKLTEVFNDPLSGEGSVSIVGLDIGDSPLTSESLVTELESEVDFDGGLNPTIDRVTINDNVIGEMMISLPASREYTIVAHAACVDIFSFRYAGLISVSGTDGYMDRNSFLLPDESSTNAIDGLLALVIPGGGQSVEDTIDVGVSLRGAADVIDSKQLKVIFE